MALTGLHATDYKSTLQNLIASKEGYKTKVYTDGVGVPTIGAGYALTKQKNWATDFVTVGITLTAAQQMALQTLITSSNEILKSTTLTTAQKESQVKALVTTYNASSNAITLNATQIGDLFETIKGTYENELKSKLGADFYNSLQNTKELVALVDLVYNGGSGIIGSGLRTALQNNDRAEAWFQIRYQSNGGSSYLTVGTGMAERRIAESNLFDLYPTDADENYYKQVMQMYEKNKKIIYDVEHNTFKPSGNDEPIKRAYEKDGLIDTQLSPAKDYLVSHYAQGITIDGDIIVGQGIGKEGEVYADKIVGSDTDLKYTNKNDLIFGERGDDTLTGGAGSDVLYGGEGYDTYATGAGDIVNDSDHKGKVYLAGHLLKGGNAISGQINQYKGNSGETYTLNADHSLTVTLGTETITIQNYDQQKQSLGIVLGKTIEVTVGDSEVYEDAKMMRVYVSINTTLEEDLTLSLMTLQQSATETEDYKGYGENDKPYGEVVIKAGETTGYIDIPILLDDIKEDTETLSITAMPDLALDTSAYPLGVKYDGTDLSSISFLNAGVGTIKDGSTKDVVITIDNASVDEDTGMMTFTITSNTTLKNDLIIDLMSLDGSAKAGEDYKGVSNGKAIISAGTTGTTFSVAITSDKKEEPNETFTLAPTGYTYTGDDLTTLLFDNAGVGTIVNDDKGLKDIEVSISNAIANEKEGTITFNITLNQELDKELSFGVMSLDGSAKAGEDYEEAKGLVTIAAGSKTGTFTVALKDDGIPESPETFTLSPDGGFGYNGDDLGSLLFMSAGEGTIVDGKDIEITISDATANEKEGTITFTVKINQPLDCDFTFNVTTIDGSATGNVDYMSVPNGTITIKKGETEAKYSITIASDGIYEKSEEFMLYAHYEKGTYTGYDLGKVTGGTGVGTITDDLPNGNCPVAVQPTFGFNFDVPTPVVSASGGSYSYSGGGSGSGSGSYYTPRVYSNTPTYNSQPTVTLPNIPVYECHYDAKLFSVAVVSLPVACNPSTPPLVFDLNHDGITSLSMAASLALFDYNADSIKEHTAWIQNGDALLVRDSNNDGLINNGSELFGDHTLKHDGTTASDGYDALRDYDTNQDGIINANDEHFNELKLWRDNGDGITQTTELKTLTEEGITSITLPDTTTTPITENGNTITNASTYTQTNGTTGTLKDVWFAYENIATETYFDTDGDGFSEKMESWMGANQGVLVWDKNKDGKINSGKEILGTNMLLPNGKTANDSFSALNAFDTNHDSIIDTKDTAGLAIWRDTNKNGQTDEGELLQIGGENSLTSINLNPFQNMLSGYDRNHDMKINSSDAIYNYMYEQVNADGTISLYLPNNADAKAMLGNYTGGESIQTSQGVKTIKQVIFYDGELPLNDTLQGTAQNDKLIGNRRSNELYGNDGRDILDAGDGNDTLEGGRGDDYLLGGAGDDTYVFKKGDGVDLIEDSGGKDTLKFGKGIAKEDLVAMQSGNDLVIGIKEGTTSFSKLTDKVVLKNWVTAENKIETLRDVDGLVIDIETIEKANVGLTINHSISCDGANDMMVANLGTDNIANSTYSISFKMKMLDASGDDMLSIGSALGQDQIIVVGFRENKILFAQFADDISVNYQRTDQPINLTFVHQEDHTGIIYVNGVEVARGTFTDFFKGTGNLQLGHYHQDYADAIFDDVKIYKKALNETEVQALAEGKTISDKLVASYDFEGDVPYADKLGNGHDGVVYGNPELLTDTSLNYSNILISETFENGAMGWTNNTTTTASELTQFLGRFGGTGGSEGISKTYNFGVGNAGKKVTIEFDMYKIDSWDGEEFDVFVNSQKISNVLPVSDAYTNQNIFTDWGSEKISHYSFQATVGNDGKLQLGFGSTLNQAISDESWGIDNIAIHTDASLYALQLHGGTDQLSTTQIVTSAKTGDQVSVSFEMKWDGKNNVMPIGFYCYDLWFKDNGFGFNTGNTDLYGILDTNFLIGSTHTITAVFTQGNVHLNKLYIDGIEQTLTQLLGSSNAEMADITKELNISGLGISPNGYRFNGLIDNVQLHDRALTQDEVSLIANKEVVHDGLVASYDFEGDVPYADKSGNGHTATASGNVVVINDLDSTHTPEDVIDSNDYKNITVDNELWVDNTKTLTESGLTELVLQTGYTGVGTSGTTAKTTTEGVAFDGTLENKWFQTDTLDTKYVYEGEVSEEIQSLANIQGQGTVRDIQHVMSENQTLADTVSTYKTQSASSSFSDLDAQMDAILAQWVGSDNYGSTSQTTPPLVLDLNGNGTTSTSLEHSEAYFDYDGNGRRELSAWVEKDDALLAVDLNGDGVINNASELFGTYTKLPNGTLASDGYNALSAYDTNHDGLVDAHDETFSSLRLWQDANQNGKTDVGELKSLNTLGVTSLSLPTTTLDSDENGNTLSEESSFTTEDGQSGTMRDVWFSYNDKHTIAVSELSDADEKKLAIVEAFLGTTLSASERANPYIVAEVFEKYDALKYDTMAKMFSNALFGEDFPSCQFMYEALNNTLARIINGKSNETEIALATNLVAAVLKRNTANALEEINHSYLQNTLISQKLQERDIEIDFVDNKLVGHVGNHYYGTDIGESLDLSSQDEGVIVEAKGGNDVLLGSEGRDRLYGASGNDIIQGNGGVDILSGRQGNDLLIGGNEQSVYEYYLGDGHDIILDQGGKNDILRFAYLEPSDFKIVKNGDDMIIYVKSPDGNFDDPFGSITIKNGYTTGKIEQFYFDSKILSFDDLTVQTISDTSYAYNKGDSKLVIEDTGGNDKIVFGEGITFDNIVTQQVGNDLIIALKFEERPFAELPDQLTIKNFFNEQNRIESFIFQNGMILNYETILSVFDGTTTDSILWGDEQDNVLVGTDSNNIFNAGAGNDTMEGKGGDDNYIFGKGSGKDTILDSSGIDSLSLGLGITREDIIIKIIGDDIILGLKEEGKGFEQLSDTVTIKNWAQTGFEIEKVVFDDGTTLTLNDLRNQAPVLTDEQVSINMQDLRQSTGTIAVTDPDGDVLNFMVTTAPTHGILSVDDKGTWVYNANTGYVGSDSVIVSIDDGNGGVVEQTLNFTLSVSAPSIITNSLSLLEDTPLRSLLDVNNPVGGTLTYEILNSTTHGNFTLNTDGTYSYNPSSNYNGVDSITLKVTNEYGLSTTQTIALDITPINDAPIVTEGTVSLTLRNIRNASGHVQSSDIDGDTLRYSTSTNPNHGTLTVDSATGQWSYSAVKGYIGADSAIIKVDDGNGGVVEQTLNFTLAVSAPTINTTALSLLEDNSYTNTLSVTNPIGGVLTYEVVDATDHGEFTLNSDGSYSYNPSSNYNGVDSVTLKVTNEYGLSTTQTIELNIASVNDMPTFESSEDEAYVLKNTRIVTGALSAGDVDGDALSYTLSTNPTHGTLTLDATTGVWSYESLFGYIGNDSATISVSDGKGGIIAKNITFNAKGLVYEGGDITIAAQIIGDKLDLGSIGMDALSFTKNGNNLSISVKDQGVITISDYFTQTNQSLKTLSTSWGDINIGKEAIKQASGSWWWPLGSVTASNGVDTLLIGSNYSDKLTGSSGDDVLFGSSKNDKLIGNAGNDLLIGGSGNDTLSGSSGQDALYGDSGNDTLDAKEGDDYLIGGSGNDTLYGGSGADKLNGGVGNDTLYGGLGNDTYYFNLGDGKDIIEDTTFSFCSWNTPEGGDDTIVFGEGIEKEDVTFLMQCGNLSIKYGDKESVVISGQSNDASAIERFELSDGSYLSSNDVESIIQQMSAYAKDHGIYISSNSSIENNQALMQIVSSGWHNA